MKRTLVHSLIALAMGALASSAQATTFINGSTMGLAGPHQTQDFSGSGLGERAPVTTQFAGVSFTRAFFYEDLLGEHMNMSGGRLGNFIANGPTLTGMFSARFAQDMKAVAFSLNSQPGEALITAWLDGVNVATASALTNFDSLNNYYIFTDLLFDELRIDVRSRLDNDIVDNVFLIDNLQTVPAKEGAVPEPGTISLALAGLMLAGLVSRRRGG